MSFTVIIAVLTAVFITTVVTCWIFSRRTHKQKKQASATALTVSSNTRFVPDDLIRCDRTKEVMLVKSLEGIHGIVVKKVNDDKKEKPYPDSSD